MQNALFDMPREPLILETQDITKPGKDKLDIWLLGRGWTIDWITVLRNKLFEKQTPNLFTGEYESLTSLEATFQEELQEYQKGK